MSGVLAPIRKFAEKIQKKKGEHAQKILGDNKATKYATRVSNQKHAAYLGPIMGTSDEASGEFGEAGAALRDPADLFGEKGQRDEVKAADEEAARIAAIPPPRPLPDEQELDRVRKKSTARQRARRGRASTIMSDDSYGSDSLGG